MRLFRAQNGFNRWVVSIVMMAGLLSFVEHTCHMDLTRLFMPACCCEEGEEVTHHGHSNTHDEDMASHMGHEPVLDTGCAHDRPHHVGHDSPSDPCCVQTMQTDLSPTWIRVAEGAHDTGIAVPVDEVFQVIKPPPLPLSQSPPIFPLSYASPPGYILFGSYLS